MKNRCSGVLMHITSLPGPFGVGGFGTEAREFVDFLKECRFGIWQVLPFHPVDEMNSPYKSESAFAGEPMFIDPRELKEDGLLSEADVRKCIYSSTPYTADYEFARKEKMNMLRTAFKNAGEKAKEFAESFCREHFWAEDYALFKAVKQKNGEAQWWDWQEENKDYTACIKDKDKYKDEMTFWLFVQYEFFKQWHSLKKYANENGIKILGDMPIYVSMDSADVWSNTELFKINKKSLCPEEVAGVPPDYFSADGQLWGNPLYDWERLEKENYRWWVQRLGEEFSMYDKVRIDHFRGLESYWAVPFGSKTAKNGQWKKGPGMKLINAFKKEYPNPDIIAEDLGYYSDDVARLLKESGFPGIRVIQFAFQGNAESEHLPHNYKRNLVVYPGTHDNNTLLGWLYELNEQERRRTLDYCGFRGDDWGVGGYSAPACRRITETIWSSVADTAIISFQDMCGFGRDARMNIPGVAELNWRFRTTKDTIDNADKEYFKKINRLYARG